MLNALRSSEVGLPLTHTQVEALTMPVLVSRLVNARQHLLALRIAEMLGLGADMVGPGPCFGVACWLVGPDSRCHSCKVACQRCQRAA